MSKFLAVCNQGFRRSSGILQALGLGISRCQINQGPPVIRVAGARPFQKLNGFGEISGPLLMCTQNVQIERRVVRIEPHGGFHQGNGCLGITLSSD